MRRRRHGRPRLLGYAVIAGALLVGCGGGHASSTSRVMSSALAYANCMRSHRVPDFPDPDGQGHFVIDGGPGSDLAPSSPAFQAAERVCGFFGSADREVTAAQEEEEFQVSLMAAACMRASGVANYPDPKLIDGSIYRNFNPSLKINPSSPAFQQAAQKCGHGQPGLVGPG